MSVSRIFTGARAKVQINGKVVGLFSQVSWSLTQGKVPNFILGRYNPAEITPVDQDAVRMSLSGYRVVDEGPYILASATYLQNLLMESDFEIVILDRQTGSAVFTAQGCRVLGWSSGAAARGVSDLRIDVAGLVAWDESTTSDDDTGAGSPASATDAQAPNLTTQS